MQVGYIEIFTVSCPIYVYIHIHSQIVMMLRNIVTQHRYSCCTRSLQAAGYCRGFAVHSMLWVLRAFILVKHPQIIRYPLSTLCADVITF
jgi:hypothetical protein